MSKLSFPLLIVHPVIGSLNKLIFDVLLFDPHPPHKLKILLTGFERMRNRETFNLPGYFLEFSGKKKKVLIKTVSTASSV